MTRYLACFARRVCSEAQCPREAASSKGIQSSSDPHSVQSSMYHSISVLVGTISIMPCVMNCCISGLIAYPTKIRLLAARVIAV